MMFRIPESRPRTPCAKGARTKNRGRLGKPERLEARESASFAQGGHLAALGKIPALKVATWPPWEEMAA
jgi:hypothetical protein